MIIFLDIPAGQWHVPGTIFENSPVPSYPEEGLHLSLLNPLPPQEAKDLKPGRLGLYSQTSSRPFGVARELPTQQSCECLCAEGAAAHTGAEEDTKN